MPSTGFQRPAKWLKRGRIFHSGRWDTKVKGVHRATVTYSYDSAGNMTHDGRKGLDIAYNCLNLPSHAETADGSSLTYTYLADGTKVSAMSGDGYGLKYRGSFVFDSNEYGDNTIQSIGWDEGRIALLNPPAEIEPLSVAPFEEPVDSTVTDMPVYLVRDLYYVSDHLGNVRSVVDISPDLSEIVILEQNDYLPFGSNVQNTSYASISENRYRYANKEEQWIAGVDLSLLDFGARYYDPYIARWTSVDPMSSKYHGLSPYGYCAENPLVNVDPNGMIIVVKGSVDFQNRVIDAGNLLRNHGIFIMDKLQSSPSVYTIADAIFNPKPFENKNQYDGNSKTIYWNSYEASYDENKTILRSPVISLTHELGHASQHDDDFAAFFALATIKDPQYSTASDKIVIQGIEQQTAFALGEIATGQVTRLSHKGYSGPDLGALSVWNQSSYCSWMNNRLPSVIASPIMFDKATSVTK